jgi:hypothetical protein
VSLRGNWRKKKALPSRKLTQKNRGNCIYAVLEVDDELVLPSAGTKKKKQLVLPSAYFGADMLRDIFSPIDHISACNRRI